MPLETPDQQQAPSSLKDSIAAKEKLIQAEAEDKDANIVTEAEVETAENKLTTRLEGLKLGGEYETEIKGDLKNLKDKWRIKISEIQNNGADVLKTAQTELIKELGSFTEQKEVKDLITIFDPFFRNKEEVVKAISFDKYQKGSGHWKAINTRLNKIGISKKEIKAMQEKMKVTPDGKVGPQTMTAMFKMYDGDKGKEVVFDDAQTVLLPEADKTVQEFTAYEAESKVIQDAMGGYNEETQTFSDPEWANLEETWDTKYKPDMTLDEIVDTRKQEEKAKKEFAKKHIEKAKEATDAEAGTEEAGTEEAVTDNVAIAGVTDATTTEEARAEAVQEEPVGTEPLNRPQPPEEIDENEEEAKLNLSLVDENGEYREEFKEEEIMELTEEYTIPIPENARRISFLINVAGKTQDIRSTVNPEERKIVELDLTELPGLGISENDILVAGVENDRKMPIPEPRAGDITGTFYQGFKIYTGNWSEKRMSGWKDIKIILPPPEPGALQYNE